MAVNVLVNDLKNLPPQIRLLIVKREEARKLKNFILSDQLRDEIKLHGYLVNDKPYGTKILKIGDEDIKPVKNFLLLFGSGEIAPSSVDIYRQAFLQFGKRNLKISLITTPAGFQPNADQVYGEIKDLLLTSLPDFNLNIEIIPANKQTEANNPLIVSQLDGSDVIFMGPGSPTYAVKHLRDTLLLTNIINQVKNGSTLVLASAATIACSKHCLPVYEIFKVGDDLHWQEGLDLYGKIWQENTIIPHFNNAEGGANLDTSFCYMGQERAGRLLPMLPLATPVLGLDEHTVLIIDLQTLEQIVRGKGNIHSVK